MTFPQLPQPPDDTGASVIVPVSSAAVPALAVAETAIAASVLAALTAWLALVASAVLGAYRRFGAAPNPVSIGSTIPAWTQLVGRIMRDLLPIAREGWEDAAGAAGLRLPFDSTNPILADQLACTRNLLLHIPDELYADMIAELSTAHERSENVDQQAGRVERLLQVSGSMNWENRAKVIAITEVNRAYAFGWLSAGLNAQQQDMRNVFLKEWDDKEDTAVRPAHRIAGGQRVPMGQPFIVGGEALMAPLDPSGSAGNVISCRCRMRLRVIARGAA